MATGVDKTVEDKAKTKCLNCNRRIAYAREQEKPTFQSVA